MVHPQAKIIRGKKLGVLVRDARLASGKTLKESAQAIGVSSSTLGAYERGVKSPSLPELEVLTYFLNVPLDHFWGQQARSAKPSPAAELEVGSLLEDRQQQIARQLNEARAAAGLSLKHLSKKVNIPSGRLSAYEAGKKPIPLPELEVLSGALGVALQGLRDEESTVGSWLSEKEAVKKFLELPPGLQTFVAKPINLPYLELAQRLSEMPAEKLRSVAESLLEITL
jgi:transcriptional regulator with XRE-family HTH domain